VRIAVLEDLGWLGLPQPFEDAGEQCLQVPNLPYLVAEHGVLELRLPPFVVPGLPLDVEEGDEVSRGPGLSRGGRGQISTKLFLSLWVRFSIVGISQAASLARSCVETTSLLL
jgi:hypothetical protein